MVVLFGLYCGLAITVLTDRGHPLKKCAKNNLRYLRHRTKRSKGCLLRDGMLHMFKLGQCAEKKWRRLRGFDYLAKVVTGIKFKDGVEVTEVDQVAA